MEQIYPFDILGNSKRHNPREQLLNIHVVEAKNIRIKITGMKKML